MWQIQELPVSRFETIKTIFDLEDLVAADIKSDEVKFIGFSDEEGLRGVGGIEFFGRHALMRALVTLPEARGQGLGSRIVAALVEEAARKQCSDVWLLPPREAMPFFSRAGFAEIPRDKVPGTLRHSRQWASHGPETAIPMHRAL